MASPNVNGLYNNCEIEKHETNITTLLQMNDTSYSSLTVVWLTSTFCIRLLLGTYTQCVFSCLLCSETAIQASCLVILVSWRALARLFLRMSLSVRLTDLASWFHKRAQGGSVCSTQSHFGISCSWWQSLCRPHGQVASLISIPRPYLISFCRCDKVHRWKRAHKAPLLAIPGGGQGGFFSSIL